MARESADPLTDAFPERAGQHWAMRRPAPVSNAAAVYQRCLQHQRQGLSVAYVHVPFCLNHCLFCGFYRERAADTAMRSYVDLVIAELGRDRDSPWQSGAPIDAVYLGGGTPSALATDDLVRLLEALRRDLPLADDCEVTVEGRVIDFGLDKARACADAGATRVSVGIQSFDTALRRRLGRKADGETAAAFLAELRDLGQLTVVCDLIYGLPGQTEAIWRRDLATCVDLAIDGVDLYALSVFKTSPLQKAIDRGTLPPPAPITEAALRYRQGMETLEAAGWQHLTQAHWRRTAREGNVYNAAVKASAAGLAFGSGAGGRIAGYRYMLHASLDRYRAQVESGDKPIMMMLEPASQARAQSYVAGELERGRLALPGLVERTDARFVAAVEPLLAQWAEAGLLRREDETLNLTAAGWFWQTNLVAALSELLGSWSADPAPQRASSPH